jgi:hypothetical protein
VISVLPSNARSVVQSRRGRVLAIVGNARSFAHTRYGEEIDACDAVIRMNAAPQHAATSHGTKTTWLAMSITVERQRVSALRPEMVFHMTPKKRWRALAHMLSGHKVAFYPTAEWERLSTVLGGKRPSTGMMCIDLAVRHGTGFDEVRIYGFDFDASGSLSDEAKRNDAPHDFALEQRVVFQLLADNSRLKYVLPVAVPQSV